MTSPQTDNFLRSQKRSNCHNHEERKGTWESLSSASSRGKSETSTTAHVFPQNFRNGKPRMAQSHENSWGEMLSHQTSSSKSERSRANVCHSQGTELLPPDSQKQALRGEPSATSTYNRKGERRTWLNRMHKEVPKGKSDAAFLRMKNWPHMTLSRGTVYVSTFWIHSRMRCGNQTCPRSRISKVFKKTRGEAATQPCPESRT